MPFVFLRPDFLLLRRAFSETPPPFPMKTLPAKKEKRMGERRTRVSGPFVFARFWISPLRRQETVDRDEHFRYLSFSLTDVGVCVCVCFLGEVVLQVIAAHNLQRGVVILGWVIVLVLVIRLIFVGDFIYEGIFGETPIFQSGGEKKCLLQLI